MSFSNFYRNNSKHAPRVPNRSELNKHLGVIDGLLARVNPANGKPAGAAPATPPDSRDAAKIRKMEEKIRQLEDRRKRKEAKEAAKLANLEARKKYSGGIDPTTGLPFRGSGVATALVMARNAAALAVRFNKMGDAATSKKLAEIAEFGRSVTEYLSDAQAESAKKAEAEQPKPPAA